MCVTGVVFSLHAVLHGGHDEQEDQRPKELHGERLVLAHVVPGDGSSQDVRVSVRGETGQEKGTKDRPDTLGHDIQEGTKEAHLSGDDSGQADDRVEVPSTDVAEGVHENGVGESESESNADRVRVVVGLRINPRPAAEEYEEHGSHEFRHKGLPELGRADAVGRGRHVDGPASAARHHALQERAKARATRGALLATSLFSGRHSTSRRDQF